MCLSVDCLHYRDDSIVNTFWRLSSQNFSRSFCNELGRRDYVTDQVLRLHPNAIPQAYLVLSDKAASAASKHVEFYAWKGFLRKVQGARGIAAEIGCLSTTVETTLQDYQQAAQAGKDAFGKTRFVSVPSTAEEEFYSKFFVNFFFTRVCSGHMDMLSRQLS